MARNAQRVPTLRAVGEASARPRAALAASQLVVLSRDPAIVTTLRALAAGRPCAIIGSETDLAATLMRTPAGVLVLDAASVASPVEACAEQLATQFPEMVLIVAGDSAAQQALAALVTQGTVYRFLHRPVSEQRARLALDAGWARHAELHARAARQPESAAPLLAPAKRRRALPLALLAMIALAGGVYGYLAWRAAPTGGAGDDRAVAQDPARARVAALLTAAERALAEQRLEDAQQLVREARGLSPDDARAVFLAARIGKERERALLAEARAAALSGDLAGAMAVLEGGDVQAPLVAETRRDLEHQAVTTKVSELLRLAAERQRSGALLEPPQDNALYFVSSASALAPSDEAVRRARDDLAGRLAGEARSLSAAGRHAAGERALDAAVEMGFEEEAASALRRELENARLTAREQAIAGLHAHFTDALADGRLLEPGGRSAKHWLARLSALDVRHRTTRAARASYADALLGHAQRALAAGQLEPATAALEEARGAGASPAQLQPIAERLDAARAAAEAKRVVDANELELVRQVAARYPSSARKAGRTGWVELEFTVRTDGSVGDIEVTQADPAGVFESAARTALAKWRYRPVMRNGTAVAQRARLRIRFTLE